MMIGIAGGSGSGKTTLAQLLYRKLGNEQCRILAQDSYYIDQSARFDGDGGSVNFDHPSAIDFPLLAEHLKRLRANQSIQVPHYDSPSASAPTRSLGLRGFASAHGRRLYGG
jgi:uridine kinase